MLCMAIAPARGSVQELQGSAASLLKLLTAGHTVRLAALLHYPPSYSAQERSADEAGVREQLDFLLQRFGGISQAALAEESPETLDFGVSGGTSAYLNSLGSFDYVDVTFSAEFKREGRGAVKIAFLKVAGGWEPWRISFCLPMSRPDVRVLAEEIAREMNAHMAEREVDL
jgi:hypothetical protein